jgi:hypothetical protein
MSETPIVPTNFPEEPFLPYFALTTGKLASFFIQKRSHLKIKI